MQETVEIIEILGEFKTNLKKLYGDKLNVDFLTLQRVRNDNSDMLYNVAPKIYQNNVHAFVGINASGKTTTLKVMSFLIQLVNNQPINSIKCNSILNGIENDESIVFEVYFYESDKPQKNFPFDISTILIVVMALLVIWGGIGTSLIPFVPGADGFIDIAKQAISSLK